MKSNAGEVVPLKYPERKAEALKQLGFLRDLAKTEQEYEDMHGSQNENAFAIYSVMQNAIHLLTTTPPIYIVGLRKNSGESLERLRYLPDYSMTSLSQAKKLYYLIGKNMRSRLCSSYNPDAPVPSVSFAPDITTWRANLTRNDSVIRQIDTLPDQEIGTRRFKACEFRNQAEDSVHILFLTQAITFDPNGGDCSSHELVKRIQNLLPY